MQECLPSAFYRALGKIIALGKRGKKHLAKFDTRQIRKKTLGKEPPCGHLLVRVPSVSTRTNGCPRGGSLPSALLLPSVFFSGLPSAKLCRVQLLCRVFFKALGKELLCRVPDIMHSANILALSKHPVSGSEEPGRAERAFAHYVVATVLKKFYALEIDELIAPPRVEIIDFLQAPSSPIPWLTEEELGQYAEKFEKTGFTGPLNYYRMLVT